MSLENLEQVAESLIEEVAPIREPIRINPDADKKVEVNLKLTLVTGHSYELNTILVFYTYGKSPSPKDVHHKIDSLYYLTSSDGKTMFKMNSVASIEVLNIKESNESS